MLENFKKKTLKTVNHITCMILRSKETSKDKNSRNQMGTFEEFV